MRIPATRSLLLILLLLNGACLPGRTPGRQPESARNIILFIGDGMGAEHRTAATWMQHGPEGRLAMDGLAISGWVDTLNHAGEVTDSAAAATALATGVRTLNGRLGLDAEGRPLPTILQRAQQQGKSVGLVTTTPVTHATPAAFAARALSRREADNIATQLAEANLDVLLGGGESDFLPPEETGCHPQPGRRRDGRNLIDELRRQGVRQVCSADQLAALEWSAGDRVLGLFADGGLVRPFAPSLAEMTGAAIAMLAANPRGFFLMVEGGQIDWASHDNDAVHAIGDTLGLDEAVRVALEFAAGRSDTLIIVTADHETGGMELQRPTPGSADADCLFVMPDGASFCVTWTSKDHTHRPVPTTAEGPGSRRLRDRHHLTHIHDVMEQVMR